MLLTNSKVRTIWCRINNTAQESNIRVNDRPPKDQNDILSLVRTLQHVILYNRHGNYLTVLLSDYDDTVSDS